MAENPKRLQILGRLQGKPGQDGKSAYAYARDAGFSGTEEEFAELLIPNSIKKYGAVGDGVTDDTEAFQTALSENRVVTVTGGTYKLSDTLVIQENCCLELSQNTILLFTQATGNCIEMRGSATLRGNHAIISVPYEMTGNAIGIDTSLDGEPHNSIPPYAKADPMFKRQRFIYDVNIVKPNAAGFYRSNDGVCNGTAIYMSADGNASIRWMWGITMSGIRIAGGFSCGIRAANFDKEGDYADNAWNHDMRIEAIIEACEIGVSLENCNGAHLAVTVQPCVASDAAQTKYAKYGVYLNDSRYVDMIGSRVWDWKGTSLWTSGGQYQHITMVGNCRGLLLDDFLCSEESEDIRELIYTDNESNFDTMSVLQEPGNKWFKSKDGKPYFFDGTSDKQLMLKTEKFSAEQAEFIHPADGYYTYTPRFTDLAETCQDGYYLDASGGLSAHSGYITTDFIPIDGADTHLYRIGGEGITWDDSYGYCRIAWYNADKTLKGAVMAWNKIGTNEYYPSAVEDDTVASAFTTHENVAPPKGAVYFRITAKGSGANLIVTLDEPQEYDAIWHGEPKRLDETIHAKNDWNASEGEVGYIENRTHYETYEEILPETVVDTDDEGIGVFTPTFEIAEGVSYEVNVNGETSECRLNTSMGMPALLGYSGGVMYVVVSGLYVGGDPETMFVAWNGEVPPETKISVKKVIAVKIPEKYLPESTVTKYVDCDLVYTGDLDGSATSAAARDGITVATFVNWVFGGYDVVIRLFEENDSGTKVGLFPVSSYSSATDGEQLIYIISANSYQGVSRSCLILTCGSDKLYQELQFMYRDDF